MWKGLTVLAAGAAGVSAKKVEIDAMKHDIQQITSMTFDKTISTSRPLTVSLTWYFKQTKADADFLDVYNEVAQNAKRMYRVTAVDCDDSDNAKICKFANVQSTPHLQVYPQNPQPPFKYTQDMNAKAIVDFTNKMIPYDKIKIFKDADEYKQWLKQKPMLMKVVLFSKDKKKAPALFRALSTDTVFQRTNEFAFVSKDQEDVFTAAGASAKKKIMTLTKGKVEWYKEKDMKYAAIYDWINIKTESGMGDTVTGATSSGGSADEEEMEFERIRELTAKSSRDICFGQKSVCAVYVSHGTPSDKAIDMLAKFESKYQTSNDRAIKYNWMWLDIDAETDFAVGFKAQEKKAAGKEERDVETLSYPTMVYVKPPKKKREEKLLSYIRMDNGAAVTEDSVNAVVERIAGGATYTRIDLPKFVNRPKKAKKGKEEL